MFRKEDVLIVDVGICLLLRCVLKNFLLYVKVIINLFGLYFFFCVGIW